MKYILGILLLIIGFVSEAQRLSVQSFRKLENDLSARGSEGRTDQNGDRCAIIKIVTTERNFVFEPDALGTMGTEQKTGEIWLYVPYGAKRLTIKHPVYGMLDRQPFRSIRHIQPNLPCFLLCPHRSQSIRFKHKIPLRRYNLNDRTTISVLVRTPLTPPSRKIILQLPE